MPSVALKLFYKGNKLSVLHTNDAHHTVVSASGQNLCEATSDATQKRFLASDAQYSTVFTHEEYLTTIAYTPYGEDTCPPDSPPIARFTGQSWLPSAVGYLLGNGHRLFNPRLMRFHSADNLSPFGKGGYNTYAYCSNDPINRIDPTGRYFKLNFKRLTGGYSYKKLSKRLDLIEPNLSKREYRSLNASITKRLVKSPTNRVLSEQLENLNSLALLEITGKKSRYFNPTAFLSLLSPPDSTMSQPRLSMISRLSTDAETSPRSRNTSIDLGDNELDIDFEHFTPRRTGDTMTSADWADIERRFEAIRNAV